MNEINSPLIGTTSNFYDPSTFGNSLTFSPDYATELQKVEKDIRLMKLQTLKITGKIGDAQYKSLLGMLASPDERDLEMARLSIRTLWDEHL